MSSTVQLRIDDKTKRAVANVFHSLGLDLSTGVKIYFQQVLNHKGIPFPLITENGCTVKEEKRLLRESLNTQKLYETGKRRGHRSVKKMFAEIASS
jgi:addiction module RelB/DinJ family antitoxin